MDTGRCENLHESLARIFDHDCRKDVSIWSETHQIFEVIIAFFAALSYSAAWIHHRSNGNIGRICISKVLHVSIIYFRAAILHGSYFMLNSVSPESVSRAAIKCFNSNSSSRNMIESSVVITGLTDIITARDPVEFADLSKSPNATDPPM